MTNDIFTKVCEGPLFYKEEQKFVGYDEYRKGGKDIDETHKGRVSDVHKNLDKF